MKAFDIMQDYAGYTSAEDILTALREVAGAAEGDTITIGPDGTVGLLRFRQNAFPERSDGLTVSVPLYAVVTP